MRRTLTIWATCLLVAGCLDDATAPPPTAPSSPIAKARVGSAINNVAPSQTTPATKPMVEGRGNPSTKRGSPPTVKGRDGGPKSPIVDPKGPAPDVNPGKSRP